MRMEKVDFLEYKIVMNIWNGKIYMNECLGGIAWSLLA